jgi:hypothetical protein
MVDLNDWSARDVLKAGGRGLLVAGILGALAIVILTLLCLFVWHIDGVFQKASINRSYSNTVTSQSYQTTLDGEMAQNIANITGVPRASVPSNSPLQVSMIASQMSELRSFCQEAVQMTTANPDYTQYEPIYTRNCIAGAPNPNPDPSLIAPAG